MYNQKEIDGDIVFNLSNSLQSEGSTLYGKIKNYMSSLEENDSKKFFSYIKSEKIIDLVILEKKLIDIS